MLNNMSILIIVLIVRTIIFKLKYKISGFQSGSSPNGLRPKWAYPERSNLFFELIKLKPNLVIFRAGTAGFDLIDMSRSKNN